MSGNPIKFERVVLRTLLYIVMVWSMLAAVVATMPNSQTNPYFLTLVSFLSLGFLAVSAKV